ncbi:SDR family oxidoreductase [Oligoflexus tunisiensis]|uniref:SDR family oxidoreductase n=1 Tax=Oligoflexus tunisiensis TaxID=708132 RepID=UPI000AD25F57|nr:SDR family oxidoreductase [Oligoflexus tunisiensis]
MRMQDREVVVITGASAGVGRATVREFAKHKTIICALARDEKRLKETQDEIEGQGSIARIFPVDVADHEAVMAAADKIVAEFGRIDIWINNAMVSVFSPFHEMTPEEYRRVTDVTYHGFVYGTMAALKHMRPRNQGTIVQVGSALAYRGIPLQSAYCGAKHAIQGFTESVRSELYHDNVDIWLTMVQLPAVNTPQFEWTKSRLPRRSKPVPPIYQPEIAARAIHWAAHNRRRELNVGITSSVVIFGNKWAPGLGDHYLAAQGYGSQQRDEPADPNAPDNLWKPVPGNYAAHGVFDDIAIKRSPQVWMNTHRPLVAGLAAGAAVAAYAFLRKERSRPLWS